MIGMASEVETEGSKNCNDIEEPFRLTIESCTDQYLAVSEREITGHSRGRLVSLNNNSEHRDIMSFKEIV